MVPAQRRAGRGARWGLGQADARPDCRAQLYARIAFGPRLPGGSGKHRATGSAGGGPQWRGVGERETLEPMPRSLLLGCESVSKAYGTRRLFDDLSFGLFEGDRAGLVGPNGSGKSTLLRILAGLEPADRGTRSLRGGIMLGYVPQDPVFPPGRTVEAVLASALEAVDEAERPGRLARALGRAGFEDGRREVGALSGGWQKRLALARELAGAPDVLLLDEPTNHLDVDGILWLEEVLAEQARACLVVSHDRYFLEHVATRMLELSPVYPRGLFEADGRYSDFLARRDERRSGQAAYQESLANTVRREIAWLRRGAKARSTKAQGRIKAAGRLIEELADARARTASVAAAAGIDLAGSERRTRRLVAARRLPKSLGGRLLVRDLDLVIGPGTRVGIIGPNGSGKTTLLNLLAGTLAPDAGEVKHAEGLRIARFEQGRASLDPAVPLRRALAPDGDTLQVQPRGGVGQALPLPARAARGPRRPALRRRAGPHPHRPPHARARGSVDPRRAHQRPRHPGAGDARGQPRRVPRRPPSRDPRPLHARPRVHGHRRPRRPGPRRD